MQASLEDLARINADLKKEIQTRIIIENELAEEKRRLSDIIEVLIKPKQKLKKPT